jgi:ferrochelatase
MPQPSGTLCRTQGPRWLDPGRSGRISGVDALLIVSFGGPEGPDDVVPFLENVTRGRGIPRERLVEVGAHYTHVGGVSPINRLNRELVASVRDELDRRGDATPVLWGNRNWDPYLVDALRGARDVGATRVFAFLTSAYSSYSGCRQYRENLFDALAAVQGEDPRWQPQVHKLRTYFNHPGFVGPILDATREALAGLPPGSRLVFTTHSIPTADADRCDYVAQHRDVAATVAEALGRPGEWDLVYQSRSGAAHVPWLEPDISDHLRALAAAGTPGAVMVPIGFVSDHMEVIWDLDTVALQTAAEVGLPVARAATPGTDPRFVAMVADLLAEQRTRLDGPPAGLPGLSAAWVGGLGPRAVPCAAGCCPNPRGPRPSLCGSDGA